MRDADIRKVLHEVEIKKLVVEDPTSRVIDEMGLMEGAFRVDVAVINGRLHGYEIKSALDTLERLPLQQASYNKVFDRLTLVVDERHAKEAVRIVPQCWGLIVASQKNGAPHLDEIWGAMQNYKVDPYALCQLLWREEALAILRAKRLAGGGIWKGTRKAMWKRLAASIEPEELKYLVRETLKHRVGWRSDY